MSFQEALRKAIIQHVDLEEGDRIIDVDVEWDSGLIADPTYGDSHSSPTFKIKVETALNGWQELNVAFTFAALLRAVLVVDE